ncbi:MAG: hypothetical protein PF447_03010 [Spirochaetaceae bacterium]|jgi:hypothetical protein|nr:hypothetical protein [Spirochaetaceae bacterium]
MKQELINLANNLKEQGLLKEPRDLAILHDSDLYCLYSSVDLDNLGLHDVQISPLADIGPAHGILDLFRQAMAARSNIRVVLLSRGPYSLAASSLGVNLPCLLDDGAQILGPVLRSTQVGRIKASLTGVSALLVHHTGGLCCAENIYDLEATASILEKCCRAVVDGWFLGPPSKISWFQRKIMHWKYRRFYSGKAIGQA